MRVSDTLGVGLCHVRATIATPPGAGADGGQFTNHRRGPAEVTLTGPDRRPALDPEVAEQVAWPPLTWEEQTWEPNRHPAR